MTEKNQVWRVMRPHVIPYGHWTRIESATELGIPDLAYTVRAHSGWLENKMFVHEGRAPPHLTREQVMWGEAEVAAGGTWHIFGKCGPVWLLYDAPAARSLLEGNSPSPTFRTTGPFPLRELLSVIAK